VYFFLQTIEANSLEKVNLFIYRHIWARSPPKKKKNLQSLTNLWVCSQIVANQILVLLKF
jgi:hypothetical protein